jgi:hypothetical protein
VFCTNAWLFVVTASCRSASCMSVSALSHAMERGDGGWGLPWVAGVAVGAAAAGYVTGRLLLPDR